MIKSLLAIICDLLILALGILAFSLLGFSTIILSESFTLSWSITQVILIVAMALLFWVLVIAPELYSLIIYRKSIGWRIFCKKP